FGVRWNARRGVGIGRYELGRIRLERYERGYIGLWRNGRIGRHAGRHGWNECGQLGIGGNDGGYLELGRLDRRSCSVQRGSDGSGLRPEHDVPLLQQPMLLRNGLWQRRQLRTAAQRS